MSASLYFEFTVRRFVGKSADGIAGRISTNVQARRPWIRKALAVAERRLATVDTTSRHRERIATDLVFARRALESRDQPTWELVDALLAAIASLLGFTSADGQPRHEVAYFQSLNQYCCDEADYGVAVDRQAIARNTYAIRRKIMRELKENGYSIREIAQVFYASPRSITQELKSGDAQG